MDAQPDVNRVAEAFTTSSRALATVSQEITHLVNVPAFNNGQRILEAIERLTTSVNTLTTDINTLRTDMNLRFGSLELRLRAESAYFFSENFIMITFYSSQNHTARVYNSHISSRDTPLHKLYDQHNRVVEGFPRDSASLMRLSGQIKSHIKSLFH